MLDARVARLEADLSDLKTDMRELRADMKSVNDRLGRIEERLARMEGGFAALGAKIDARPTTFTLAVFLVSTSIATVGVIVAILSLVQAA